MQAADNAGLDLTPIPGPPEVVFPKFQQRFIPVIKALPDEKRILTDDDVFYDDDPQSAGTGTWYDFMSPGLLRSAKKRKS